MEEDIGKRLVQALKDPANLESQESIAKAMELTKAYAVRVRPPILVRSRNSSTISLKCLKPAKIRELSSRGSSFEVFVKTRISSHLLIIFF